MVNTTTYRKDFTDEERLAYNKYMVSRMQVFRKTEHGREVVNANNRKAYYEENADKIKNAKIEYRQLNKEKINARRKVLRDIKKNNTV